MHLPNKVQWPALAGGLLMRVLHRCELCGDQAKTMVRTSIGATLCWGCWMAQQYLPPSRRPDGRAAAIYTEGWS